jgi:hypothetical protein
MPDKPGPDANDIKKNKIRVILGQKTYRFEPTPIGSKADPDPLPPPGKNMTASDIDERTLAHVLLRQFAQIDHPDSQNSAAVARYVKDFRRRVDPRDPFEEMLVGQLLVNHTRVLQNCHLASRATDMFDIHQLNDQTNRAVLCFQRQFKTLMRHRNPDLTVFPANIKKMTIEREMPHAKTPLPPDSQGVTGKTSVDPTRPPLDQDHRPQDLTRQEDIIA